MSAIKGFWHYIGGLNGLLLILYSVFCFSSGLIVGGQFSPAFCVIAFSAIVILSVIFCPLIIRFLSGISIHQRKTADQKRTQIIVYASFYTLPLIVFLLYYLAYYPGGFDTDCINQYYQMFYNDYSDWHPTIQTLLVYKLPFALTGGWIGSIVLFQLLAFSLALGYSLSTLYKHTNTKYALVSMMFILLNPQLGNFALFPYKDVAFSICALLMLTFSYRIFSTKGMWIKNPVNTVLFIIITSFTTLSRHNAVLFALPLLIAALIFLDKRHILLITTSCVLICLFIKYPFYSTIGVAKPDNRQVEVLGLPMTVIGAAVTYEPDSADEETLKFAYSFSPKEVWEEKYVYGNYNALKWDDRTNVKVVEEYGIKEIFSMMFRCVKASKKECLISLVKLTDAPYTVTDRYFKITEPYVYPNVYGIYQQGNDSIKQILRNYGAFVSAFLPHLFMYLGSMHLILLASVLSKQHLNNIGHWKRIMFVIPVFAYNFITTMLLSTYSDAVRFFFYTFLLMPVLLAFLYKSDGPDKPVKKALKTSNDCIRDV